ncbi:hypothetical protein [Gottfriedia acidiceleris]|uniref:hypothetical protein n=1 Tax=Gottfriedia acidiceleris TaxID=371036 RepID=UPI003000F150
MKVKSLIFLVLSHLLLIIALQHQFKIGLWDDSGYSFALYLLTVVFFVVENKVTKDDFWKKDLTETLILVLVIASMFLPIAEEHKQILTYSLIAISFVFSYINRMKRLNVGLKN